MRKFTMALAAATLSVPAAMTLPSPAEAQARYYDRSGNYVGPTWRGEDGRLHCKRPNGTTGLIVGGAAGLFAGRAVDTRGSRTTGTVLGGAIGALLGGQVERNLGKRCR